LAQTVNGCADAVLEFDDGTVRPQDGSNLLSRNQISRAREQHGKDSEWLLGKADRFVSFADEFTGTEVELETVETGYSVGTLELLQLTPRDWQDSTMSRNPSGT
jgi:hypothetical protein